MPRFVIQRVRFRPAGEERPDTPHAGYECTVSTVAAAADPAVVHVRYEQLKPLMDLWKLERPSELARRQFDAPEQCRDPGVAFEHLLDLVMRKIDPELIQSGWYLAHVAQALADLRCPRFDAVQLAGSERFFSGAFDAEGALNREWLATLAADVSRRSGGVVSIEDADATEFVTNPPQPVAYLVVVRGDERLWLILRPWPNGIPLVTDDDLEREGTAHSLPPDASVEARLIELYNERYAKIFVAATKKEREEGLKRDVASFLSGSTGLAELFHGLSLREDGTLDPDAVLANLAEIRTSRKLEIFHQGLSELLDFLMFSAMEALGPVHEQDLERQVQELLDEGGESGGDALPSDTTDLIEEFTVGDPDDPATSRSMLDDLDEIAMEPASPPPAPPPFYLPPPSVHLPSPDEERAQAIASALRVLSTAEGEANLAVEKLEHLERQLHDANEREAVLRAIEHIRATLRELAMVRALFSPPPARR